MDYLRLWAEDAHAQERHTLAHTRALRVHSSPKARWLLQPRALPSPKTALNTQAGSSTARHGERAEGLSGEGTDRRVLWTPGGDVPLLPREPSRWLFQPGPPERPRRRHRERISPSSFFLAKTLTLPLAPPLLFQTATLASVRNLRCPLVGTPVSRQTCIPLSPGDARRPLEPVSCCPAGPTANPGVLRKTHGERRKAASPWDHTAPHSPCTYVCGGHQSHRCSSARYGEQGTGPRSPNWAGVTLGPESRRHPPSLSERSRTQLLGRKLPSFCYFLISH